MTFSYENISSGYILEVLQETAWEERGKVDRLVRLDHYLDNPPHSFAGALEFFALKTAEPQGPEILLGERSPERLQAELAERASRDDENRNRLEQQQLAESEARESWIRAGGRG